MASKRRPAIDDGTNGIRHWLTELTTPQTILWGALVITGLFTSWLSVTTRISVLETGTAVQIAQMQKRMEEIETDSKRAIEAMKEGQARMAASDERRLAEADQRLWLDISDLRRQVMENTYRIGQSLGQKK